VNSRQFSALCGSAPDSVFESVRGLYCSKNSQIWTIHGQLLVEGFHIKNAIPFSCLRSRTHFRRYRGCRVPFSCFALPDSFSAIPRASGPAFMFCALGLIFGGTGGVRTLFHVLRSRTRFRRYCFARPDSFSTVPMASGPFFMFCAPGLVFGGTKGVVSHFDVLRARTHFPRYRGHRVPLSWFVLPDSFSTVLSASGAVFMFFARGLVFVGNEGITSIFYVLLSETHFRRYRGRRVAFSTFALPDSFSAVPRASGPVFMFCVLELVFDGTGCVGCRIIVLRVRTHFRWFQGC
jgi:hypothetical protein